MPHFTLHPVPLIPADRPDVAAFIRTRWVAESVIAHGVAYQPAELDGFVVRDAGAIVGLVTYHIAGDACEIVTIDSIRPGHGLGSALVAAVAAAARQAGCRRLWLITTNDNLPGVAFYQKRGFRLVAVHRDAVTRARALKPSIPFIGHAGIPLRDEWELELSLALADSPPASL